MESTLNKIGILTFVANVDHGVFNYTKSLIDALRNDSTNKYILLSNENLRNEKKPLDLKWFLILIIKNIKIN